MLRKFSVPALTLGLLAVAGCDVFDDDDDDVVIQTASFQVLHASSDAPPVNVIVDGSTLAAGADYKQGTGFNAVQAGTYTVQVDGILPTGPAPVIGPVDLALEADTETTIIAIDNVANITPLIITNPREAVPAGNIRATVVHASPVAQAAAAQVDVFVTAPGADLAASAPLGTFSFGETLGPVEVPAGDYQIRVTPAGTPGTVVYDSGTQTLPDGFNGVFVAVDNTTRSTAPIGIVVLDGSGAAEIVNDGTPAAIRVIHNSPDAPAVDVVVNDDFNAPLVEDLTFPNAAPNFTDFVEVPADTYNIKVTVANTPGTIAIDADLTFEAGLEYSVYATDVLANITPQLIVDDRRPVATGAKVRIIHGSPTAQDVDIYVTAPGTDITTVAPNFEAVAFGAETGYVPLAAGTYTVTVTPTGTTTAAIGPVDITVAAGGTYTAVARDPLPGGSDLGLILLDDFN